MPVPVLPTRPTPGAAPAPGALDLLEEAVHGLRRAPAGTLACYYGATLPFVLGLLYFWADLSRDAAAELRAPEAALGLSALFLWMKTGQAVFAERLRTGLLGPGTLRGAPRWTPGRLGRLFLVQATLQPSGLLLLPVAALATLPFGWVYAFYQSLTALGDEAGGSPRVALARAGRAAALWPRQNHAGLAVVFLLAFVVWVDGMAAAFLGPELARIFTGSDNMFTRNGLWHLLNSTFLAVSVSLVYVAVDPLVKSFYVLRCFYADARHTGQDLRRELQALPPPDAPAAAATAATSGVRGALAAGLLVLLLLAAGGPGLRAAEPGPAPPPPAAVAPGTLDRSIEQVLRRREFSWRLPPRAGENGPKEPNFLVRWLRTLRDTLDRWGQWWRKLFQRDREPAEKTEPRTPGFEFSRALLQPLAYVLIGSALLAGLFLFWNARRRVARAGSLVAAAPPAAGPDPGAAELADEATLATRLPEDEWLRLGRELRDRGELRLALRAFYLSVLAGLAARGLVNVARHKSNGDYVAETRRRARDRAGLAEEFAAAVRGFERSWYGRHPADDAALDGLLTRRESIVGGN